jgi:ferrous iron transport protein B
VTPSPPLAPPAASCPTLLVGNPNVGKSVLFGILSGRYADVSNYPGTTVEITRGEGPRGELLDTPGTNSLLPSSEDERVTRDVLLQRLRDGPVEVLQVCDAKNLRRGVQLLLELAELEAPTALVVNMLDEARSRGIRIDHHALANELGVEIVPAVATRREGLSRITGGQVIHRPPTAQVTYPPAIEAALDQLTPLLPEGRPGRRGLALMLLSGDRTLGPWADLVPAGRLHEIRAELERELEVHPRLPITRARLQAADRIVAAVLSQRQPAHAGFLARLGDLAMHPLWGLPIAAVALYLLYLFVGVLGAGVAVDYLESTVFEGYLVPGADWLLRAVTPGGLETFLVGSPGTTTGTGDGLLIGQYGLFSMAVSYAVAIVLPVVGFFFLAFSLMEDSGYLPRLAVMLNRLFRVLGLNGKAVLPMVLGLGCSTMAIMTTRILPTRKERILVTLLLALGIPCSAQLGVILGLLSALSAWALACWLVVVAGVVVLVGHVASRIIPGYGGDFILEVPPMRRPQLRNCLRKTGARVWWYLKEAVPLFILGTFVLWLLAELHVLEVIQRVASPVVEWLLGLPPRATDAFLVGFLRRDYGAAGLYAIFQDQLQGESVPVLVEIQVVVAMVTITLFVPCIASVFMMIKERGWLTTLGIAAFILPFALLVGGGLNHLLRALLL